MSVIKKDSKNKKLNKKTLSIVILTSAIWSFAIAGLGYVNQYTNVKTISFDFAKQNSTVLVANRDMGKGELIKSSDLILKEFDSNYITKGSIQNGNQLVGKQTTHKIYKNEQMTPADIIEPEIIKDNLVAYSIPVNLSVLHDNNIKVNDYVDIMIDFREKVQKTRTNTNKKEEKYSVNKPSEIVAAKVRVTQIIDGKGNLIIKPEMQNPNERQQPAFISVLIKKEFINNIDDAKKRGNLNLVKYLNSENEESKENYKPSWLD